MRRIVAGSLLVVIFLSLGSWGFLVHRTVHQLAVYELPKPLQSFFYKNIDYLVDNAGRPDQRRNQDSTEASKHFIDLEAYGDSSAWRMPFGWNDAIQRYSRDTLLEYGYVPYHIMWMKNKLTDAYRSLNRDSILFYANDLAHYIGDANVPLHTSLNYDGQLSNQSGLHSLWESMIPEIMLDKYNLYEKRKAVYVKNPEQAVWDCIRRSHRLLPDVFGQEINATKDFVDTTKYRVQVRRGKEVKSYTSAFAKRYSELLGKTINDQLLNSAAMISDFWYTAWVDAGRPDLSAISNGKFTDSDKDNLKKELKAWKHNELISQKLLRSRKEVEKKD